MYHFQPHLSSWACFSPNHRSPSIQPPPHLISTQPISPLLILSLNNPPPSLWIIHISNRHFIPSCVLSSSLILSSLKRAPGLRILGFSRSSINTWPAAFITHGVTPGDSSRRLVFSHFSTVDPATTPNTGKLNWEIVQGATRALYLSTWS